jgi:Sulfotransferase family
MPVILKKYGIAYFPVPKVACSSVKHLLFFLEHGRHFEKYVDSEGRKHNIHNTVYPTLTLAEDDWACAAKLHRIAVIRDPMDRFVSAYRSRVAHFQELSETSIDLHKAAELGVTPDPELDQFIDNLELYRILSGSIKHHTDPQTFFLGHTLDYFDQVYKFEELKILESDLRARTQIAVELPHLVKGPGGEIPSIPAKRVRKIIEFYSGDYALLKGLYSPECVTKKYVTGMSGIKELLRQFA